MTLDALTPTQYIERLKELIVSGRDEEALDFSTRVWSTIRGKLSPEEFLTVSDMMHAAQLSVDLAEAHLIHQER